MCWAINLHLWLSLMFIISKFFRILTAALSTGFKWNSYLCYFSWNTNCISTKEGRFQQYCNLHYHHNHHLRSLIDSFFSPPPPSPIYLLLHIHLLDSGHLIVKYSPVITNLLILLFLSAESALLIGGICFSHWRNCIFIGPCLSTHCGYHSCHSFASVQSWWSVWAFLKC